MTRWVTAWAMAHTDASSFALSLGGRTSQVELYCPIGGKKARIKLSNRFGTTPVQVNAASIWVGGQSCLLTFGGKGGVSIAPGQELRSDGAELQIPAGAQVRVRLYLEEGQAAASGNALIFGQHSIPGNHTGSPQFPVDAEEIWVQAQRPFPLPEPVMLLSALEVANDDAVAVAILGDSNTFNGFYTKPLAVELARRNIALLNLGISGNRALYDSAAPSLGGIFGIAAQKRIQWDIFDLCGLKTVLLAVGGNDIYQPGTFAAPATQLCSAQQLWDATVQMYQCCRARGISVVGSTLVPFSGAEGATEEKLSIARQYNQTMQNSMIFGDIIDFDSILSDPDQADTYLPAYDSGDHLHFNAAAGIRIAECAIDLFI